MRRKRLLGPAMRKRKKSGGMGGVAPPQDQSRVSSEVTVRHVDPASLRNERRIAAD